jgi:hypothetical protein
MRHTLYRRALEGSTLKEEELVRNLGCEVLTADVDTINSRPVRYGLLFHYSNQIH